MKAINNLKSHIVDLCTQNVGLLEYFVKRELHKVDVTVIEVIEEAFKVLLATRTVLFKELTDDAKEIYEQQFVIIEANGAIFDKSGVAVEEEKRVLVAKVDSVKERLLQELASNLNPLIEKVEALRELAVAKLSELESVRIASPQADVPTTSVYKASMRVPHSY